VCLFVQCKDFHIILFDLGHFPDTRMPRREKGFQQRSNGSVDGTEVTIK
jgi:hypothetical protein